MQTTDQDTIFALSSGAPPAGIGIIRISGPAAGMALTTMAGSLPIPRKIALRTIKDATSGEILDRGVILWIPGPNTATGEDLAEIHCHGGRAVVEAILSSLSRMEGLYPAEPGAFTRRAFVNGRIDLNEAEGLADLLVAETQGQRQAAVLMAGGHFSRKVENWQRELLQISAHVEALLDFSDEDDVPDAELERGVRFCLSQLTAQLADEQQRPYAERLREGIRVVLAGPPNAGKSTLLNALTGYDHAIVSDIAGTTRDRIEVPVAIAGIPFLMTDTAGIHSLTITSNADRIEAIGIDRAREAVELADILLWLGPANEAPRDDTLLIAAQADRNDDTDREGLSVSAVTGEGMELLLQQLVQRAHMIMPRPGEYALQLRQREAVARMYNVMSATIAQSDLLLVAEDLRLARREIDRLTGRAGTEDMLDALFSGLCIGK